jgi:hypothetical protein
MCPTLEYEDQLHGSYIRITGPLAPKATNTSAALAFFSPM